MHTCPKTIHTILNERRPWTVDIVSSPIVLLHICFRFLRTENASNMFTIVPENANESIKHDSLFFTSISITLTCHRFVFRQRLWALWILYAKHDILKLHYMNIFLWKFSLNIRRKKIQILPDSISILECSESGCNLALLTAYL